MGAIMPRMDAYRLRPNRSPTIAQFNELPASEPENSNNARNTGSVPSTNVKPKRLMAAIE